jgi:uncharacterized phiE125 gp8 family phage protein
MSLRLVTPASALAVSLAEAKAHLRVDSADEDTLITAMITSATEVAEQLTGRAIMPQTWELTLDTFANGIVLTRVPATAITTFTYVDGAGATQTPVGYRLRNSDDFGLAVVLPAYGTNWPETLDDTETVKVRFTAGYADAAAVPEPIKAWIKLTVSTMYENREGESYSARAVSTTVKMSFVDGLLDRYRVYS